MNVQTQTRIYYNQLASRKRNPPKPATLAAYDSYIRTWIVPLIGELDIRKVENGVMKAFVSKMADKGLSASTIAGVTNCLKGVISSCIDMNGNELYPRKWNNDFIDAPIIDPAGQKTPIMTSQEVTQAIQTVGEPFGSLLALLAGSGLRISEALALKGMPSQESSYLDLGRNVVVVRKALYKGREQSTKTPAGIREIDLNPSLVEFLRTKLINNSPNDSFLFQNSDHQTLHSTSSLLRDAAKQANVPGFHSLRRFRVTHLETQGVPRSLVKFWTGHAGREITDRYIKIGQDIQARKEWAVKAGLGFDL